MSISVNHITKSYGDQKAVDSISFQVGKGEIVGLLGPNGAGKTTTMKILCGFMTEFSGTATVNGFDVRTDPIALKRSVGYLPEHNPLYLDMYIAEYLEFVSRIHQLSERKSRIKMVLDQTGLESERHKKIGALSKGYRQRVGLAQALIHDPEVLVLDEPTSGLDPNQLIEIRQLIRQVGSEKTVIFSSHIMQEVQALCQRVVILNRGKLVANESIDLLDNLINKERKILVELDREWKGKWNMPGLTSVEKSGGNRFSLVFAREVDDPRLATFDYVVARGYKLLELQEQRSSFEDIFKKVTAG